MKRFRFTAIVLALLVIFSAAAPLAHATDVVEIDDAPDTTAAAVLLADMNSGEILYRKNEHEQRAPASLTKIMTVLIAVEKIESGALSLDTMIEAKEDCRNGLDSDSTTADIYPGEIMSLQDLIYCAMLGSANEACNIIGRYIGNDSVQEFVNMMNARAEELGCANTHFVNTNGLTAEGHYTCAYDLYLITSEAVTHPIFMTACNTITYTTQATNTCAARTLNSTNALICSDSMYGDQYLYKSAAGVKTGHTNAAGFCLVSTAERNGIHLVCIVLGCEGNYDTKVYKNFEETITLYNWVFNNYEYQLLLTMGTVLEKAEVEYAKDNTLAILHPDTDVRLLLTKDYDPSQLTIETTVFQDRLVAPIEAGTVLGQADVYINGEKKTSVNLITDSDIELSRFEMLKQQFRTVTSSGLFKTLVIMFIIFIAGYFLLVVRYRKMRQEALKKKKQAELRRKQEWQKQYAEQTRYNSQQSRSNSAYYNSKYGFDESGGYTDEDVQRYFDNYGKGDDYSQSSYDDGYSSDSGYSDYYSGSSGNSYSDYNDNSNGYYSNDDGGSNYRDNGRGSSSHRYYDDDL